MAVKLYKDNFDKKSKLENIMEFFECPVCFNTKDNIFECSSCKARACVACLEDFSKGEFLKNPQYKAKKMYKCTICLKVDVQRPMHKFLNNLLNDLRFKCQSCHRTLPYSVIKGHKARFECYPMEENYDDDMQMEEELFQPQLASGAANLCKSLFIFERDSKFIYEFELQNQQLFKRTGIAASNFPHNFQTVLTPTNRLFFIGGGDFNHNHESLYKCYEVDTQLFEFTAKDKLKFPRHGHAACSLGEKFILVTGSRKETDNSQSKCEQYNIDLDIWFEIPSLNEGRHYHASCSFKDKFVYVFCGISNATKKYINTIEKYDNQTKKNWEVVMFNQSQATFHGRQGLGVAQMNNEEILVFGGFCGKFMKDAYIFSPMKKELKQATPPIQEIFSFQMPTVYEKTTGTVYTADWQKLKIFSYKSNSWNVVAELKK